MTEEFENLPAALGIFGALSKNVYQGFRNSHLICFSPLIRVISLKMSDGILAISPTTVRKSSFLHNFVDLCVSAAGGDSKKLRRTLRHRGSKPLIPRRQFLNSPLSKTPKPYMYKSRWQIEKAFSETDQFRKLVVRQERDSKTYKQYWYLGLAWLELKKLTG